MRFSRQTLIAACAALALSPATVRAQDSLFASYDEMRQVMDSLVMTRNIQDLMIRFGGADEMTTQQLDILDTQVEQIYLQDFENVTVLRRVDHMNGFSQELLAYWTGYDYLFAYVFMQDRGSEVISINFRFNSDFAMLNALF